MNFFSDFSFHARERNLVLFFYCQMTECFPRNIEKKKKKRQVNNTIFLPKPSTMTFFLMTYGTPCGAESSNYTVTTSRKAHIILCQIILMHDCVCMYVTYYVCVYLLIIYKIKNILQND